ncbi:MAG: TPM domain-containing protein [Clostridia bacterium]|nr:TPM domain-containing protein [Clostridia bacterium]
MVLKNKRSLKLLSLLLAFVMLFTVCGTAVFAESVEGGDEAAETTTAETVVEIPAPTAKFYVRDEEEIINTETENAIISRNETLFEKYGIQIIILSLKTIPGKDINEKGAYLHRIVDSWQAGGTEEKCLMLAISAQEQNYIAIAGDGLSEAFPVETWSQMLDQHLEPDFAAAQYDAGVQKIFTAVADKAELYAVNNSAETEEAAPSTDSTVQQPEQTEEQGEKTGVLETIMRVIVTTIFIIVVVGLVGFIVIYAHGQHVKKKRREERRRKAMQARAQQNDQQVKKPESYSEFINRY